MRVVWQHIPSWLKDYASMSLADIRYRIRSTISKFQVVFLHRLDLQKRVQVEEILEVDFSRVPERNVELTQTRSNAFHEYIPRPCNGKVTPFRARNRSFNEFIFGSLDPRMGWGGLVKGGIDVRVVDGFHLNIHLHPFVCSLASELS